jgi:hypothetical protein
MYCYSVDMQNPIADLGYLNNGCMHSLIIVRHISDVSPTMHFYQSVNEKHANHGRRIRFDVRAPYSVFDN